MKKIYIFKANLLLAFFGLAISTQAQQIQKSENGTFILKNGTIHTITKGTFVGEVLVQNGTITAVSSSIISVPDKAKSIDCTGKHIYPGMIDAGSRLGLVEIDAVSVTNDFRDLGDFIPHMKALTAVNPNAVAIPVTRVNGVTTVFAKPEGSTFSGTGALIDLHGYTPEQMYAGAERVVMRFPSTGRRGRWDKRSDEDIKKDSEKALKNINEIWDDALQYNKIDSTAKADKSTWSKNNPQMDALMPIIHHEQPLMIEVNSKNDIESAITWITDRKIKTVFMGVAEGYRVADKIAKAGIPVITGPVQSNPRRDNDKYDVAYTNAGLLHKAGVKVAIRTDNAENTRNLPFQAGFAAAYGLGIEEALKCVTINTAEILGVADKYGSIEVGKVANLFVSTGDPFEMKTRIEHLFIKGWKIPIESRQTLLYDEFIQRSPGN
jgi:imidazolonepropionase-like amidohydrolase